MKRILITTALLSTLVLTGCGKSDAYHIGRCAAGQLSPKTVSFTTNQDGSAQSATLLTLSPFVKMAFNISAKQTGLNPAEMEKGFIEYYPGDDYSNSCKIARAIDNGLR
jgi:hypothetical protein